MLLKKKKRKNFPGLLLLIDFENAFDSVSWDFLFDFLDLFNFDEDFKNWIKSFVKTDSLV